ncbi:MAG TPA: hypothetical protein VFB58_04690 [Chloroflexota bacterium]|nr:hypothetical protein [Chloroflexota bacterium]
MKLTPVSVTVLLICLALSTAASVSGTTPASARAAIHRTAEIQSLAGYFPAARQYPAGYKAMAVQQYSNPGQLFTNGNVSLARRDRLMMGAMQTAINRHDVVATIMIARFRTPTPARRFSSSVQSDVTPDDKEKSGTIRSLGSTRARYVTGDCAGCGPTAPPLYQVFFARGPIFVEISTQPRDQTATQYLARLIDGKLKSRGFR